MSKLNTAQRKALSLDDFGDPDNRLFPIVDQDDVDSAAHLIGKAKNPGAVKTRIIAIAKRKGLRIPDAWKTGAKMGGAPSIAAHFELAATHRRVEGDYAVYPNSLVWVAGEYPDKRYAMSPEENWLAVEHFTPVSGNIEHTDFLAGKACHVRSLRLDGDDSALIRAEVAVPLALDGLMGQRERGLSCEWNRDTKQFEGLALTTNPRIPEAALMSNQALVAFAGRDVAIPHTTYDGQKTLQTLHDLAAKSGALCDPGNPQGTQSYSSSYFVSSGERSAMQTIHDACTAGGAKCSALGKTSNYTAAIAALFAGNRHNKADMADIQKIHDLAQGQGATCAPATMSGAGMPEATKGRTTMGSKFSKFFGLGREGRDLVREAGGDPGDEDQYSLVASEVDAAREAAHREELARFAAKQAEADARLKEANDALFAATAQRLQGEAAAFADGLIVGHKLLPAEREGLIAALTTAGLDDASHGPVTFANGTSGSRVAQLKAMYEVRPTHNLTQEQLAGNAPFTALAGGQAAPKTGPDSYSNEKLLSMTAAGRQALARKAKQA